MEGTSGSQYQAEEKGSDADKESGKVKVIEWEEFQEALAHLCGLGAVLTKARVKREALSQRMEEALEIRKMSSQRVDSLEAMQRQLQAKQRSLESALATFQASKEELARVREKLLPSAQALIVSSKVLSDAQCRLQDAGRLLAGEGGHERLQKLCKVLDARRRTMVAQMAALYPLATCTPQGLSPSVKRTPHSHSQPPGFVEVQAGVDIGVSSLEGTSMAIAGLQLLEPGKKQPGLFNEKQDYDISATALGYVAHVVSMVAGILDVQLRYPVRLGASHSYIQDYCPAIEPIMVDLVAPSGTPQVGVSPKAIVEFPLFSEGQDLTRSAYAVFLLNKDLEQILNELGVESVGPRHTLLNLTKLISTATSRGKELA